MTGLFPTGFPVPRTYGLCEDPDIIGSKFFVMSMADGRSLWNGALPGLEPDERREHYHALIDTMADLHLNQPDRIGMGDYGKPTDYCARQIAPLVETVQSSPKPEFDAGNGAADRMAATDNPAAARFIRGAWRLPPRQCDLPQNRSPHHRGA